MNREQYDYDVGVQILNRSNDIKLLEAKLERLKALKLDIYNRGQEEKRCSKRQNTLVEYRKQVDEYNNKIKRTEELTDSLKKRNGLISPRGLPPVAQPVTPPVLQIDPKYNPQYNPIVKKPSKVVVPNKILLDMDIIVQMLIAEGDIINLRPEIQNWILQFYEKEVYNLEKINDTIEELNKEIDVTTKKLKQQRDCCF